MQLGAQVLDGAVVGEHLLGTVDDEPDHGGNARSGGAIREVDSGRDVVETTAGQPHEVADLLAQHLGELLAVRDVEGQVRGVRRRVEARHVVARLVQCRQHAVGRDRLAPVGHRTAQVSRLGDARGEHPRAGEHPDDAGQLALALRREARRIGRPDRWWWCRRHALGLRTAVPPAAHRPAHQHRHDAHPQQEWERRVAQRRGGGAQHDRPARDGHRAHHVEQRDVVVEGPARREHAIRRRG